MYKNQPVTVSARPISIVSLCYQYVARCCWFSCTRITDILRIFWKLEFERENKS